MSRRRRRTSARSATTDRRLIGLAAIRGAWGGLLLIAPAPMIESVPGASPTRATRAVARVLGGRQLIQAGAALAGSQLALRAWWVDALHSTTMAGLALWVPADGRLAGADALTAAAFATATRRAARTNP